MQPQTPADTASLAEDFLGVDEAARFVGAYRGTLRRWVAAGQFPKPIALGPRRKVWRRSTLMAWIAAQEAQAA